MIVKKPELLQVLRKYYEDRFAPIEEANIFGIRFPENQDQDVWNDVLGIWTMHDVYCWVGTTDPGKYATENSSKGAAHLCLGYHENIWQAGIHGKHNPRFAHPALIQTGNAVRVWRDKNRDYNNDEGIYDIGYFGINWHRASRVQDVAVIGPYSAGCQVTQNVQDFEFGLNLLLNTEKFKKDNNYKFSYMLFSHKEINI